MFPLLHLLPVSILGHSNRPLVPRFGCSKHMTGQRSQFINFVSKFMGTVRFRKDHVAAIRAYGDYQVGNVTISRVYYVEGLRYNLFSVGQFCDSDIEVAFRKNTCYVCDLEGVDLLKGSRGLNLYTMSLEEMVQSSPICLLSTTSKTKSWIWHRRLSHLNIGAINDLARQGLVKGIPAEGEFILMIRGLDVASNQGSRFIAWRIIKIEGPGLIDEERLRVLEASPLSYIRRTSHSLGRISFGSIQIEYNPSHARKETIHWESTSGEDEFHDDNLPPPPPVPPTQQAPHTLSTIKLPILKKGEYDIWAMKMEHYLGHTDYPIWEPPKTAEEILARERERKARTSLLMSIPEDHLAKFHKITDAKEMWEAIKSRFGGNDEFKKMQKYILKQQIESFSVSPLKMPIRSFLGLYLASVQVFLDNEDQSQDNPDVAFVSSQSTSSTNDVSTAYGVSTSSGYNSQRENSSSYTDELMYSFFANQSDGPHLDHEDLEQLDEFNLEEIDLKWKVAMISIRLKKFYNKAGRKLHFDAKEPVGFDKTKVECYNCHKKGHFARECRSKGNTGYKSKDNGRRPGKQEEPKALVTLDGEGVDWIDHAEDEQENFALMAYSNSGSDTEVTSCSKECVESYAKLKKLYDEQREQLGDASIEIQAYTQALKKVEAQLVTHQKNQLWYEEKIRFMKIDLDDKTDVLTYHKKLLAEAVKEKEELKTKLENFQSSSKGLSKLLNSQMSKRDKSGLGYGDQVHDGVLSYENEVFQSVFDNRSSDVENSSLHDRFTNVEGMHAVPPPMTGNYMPSGPNREVDDSMFTYGPKQSKTSKSDTQTSNYDSCESNSSIETCESAPEQVVVEPNVVSQRKVWPDAPIIEEYESDSDDEYVIQPSKEQERPSFASIDTVKHVKTPRETVKE
ncbi:putative ribonuclease H-like domain-containing protein [Tanacetum coccineum]